MRKLTSIFICSLCTIFLASCSRETMPAFMEEGEITLPMVLSGDVTPFDSPTKAPEDFTFTSDNVLYLCLHNAKDEDHPLIGRATYNNSAWSFTFQGSYENLSYGSLKAYLFANNYSKNQSVLNISYRTPVYGTENGSYSIVNDTLKVTAVLKPVTGRVTFNREEGTQVNVRRLSGISYFTRFNIEDFAFESSSAPFEYGWMNYGDYLYGTLATPEHPLINYNDSYNFVCTPSSDFLQVGKSGYMLPPTPGNYNGWMNCGSYFEKYDNYRWVVFRYVGAGTYAMGEEGFPVTIEKPFYIMRNEVTDDLWRYAMDDDSISPEEVAVSGKSYEEILLFCEKLSQKWDGYSFRLPTEAEWELAAKGGMLYLQDYRYSGSDNPGEVAHLWTDETYDDENPFRYWINRHLGTSNGVFDMTGNVAELCSDWYDDTQTVRAVRGGSAYDFDKKERLTVTHRCSEADYPADQIGFRLIVEVTPFMFD